MTRAKALDVTESGRNLRSLLAVGGRYAVAGMAQHGLFFLLLPVYTTCLMPADFGALALLATTGMLLNRTIDTPLAGALHRFYYRPGYEDRREILVFNLALFALAQSLIGAICFYVASQVLASTLIGDNAYLASARAYSIVVGLSVLTGMLNVFFVLVQRSKVYLTASVTNAVLSALITTVLLLKFQLGLFGVVIGQIAGHLGHLVISVPVFAQYCCPVVDLSILSRPLKYGYATIVSGYSTLLIHAGDRFLLRAFGTVTEVGLYSFGANFGNALSLIYSTPLDAAIWPRLRQLEATPNAQREAIARVTTRMWAVGVGLCLILALVSFELIHFIAGPAYQSCWVVIPIVALARMTHALAGYTEAGLVFGDRPALLSRNVLLAGCCNFAAGCALIPWIGISGAALASVIARSVWNWLNVRQCVLVYSLQFEVGRLVRIGLAGIVLGSAAMAATTCLPLIPAIIIKVIVFAAYVPLLYVLDCCSQDDWRALAAIRGLSRKQTKEAAPARAA